MKATTTQDRTAILVMVLLLGGAFACSGDDDDDDFPGPVAQGFRGTFITVGGISGTLEFTRSTAVPLLTGTVMGAMVDVTGTLTPAGGAPTGLIGSIDNTAGFFEATGGGYFLAGFFDNGLLGGGISGPSGSGSFAALSSDFGMVQIFCGDWILTGDTAPAGLFSLSVVGGQAVATVVNFAESDSFLLTNNLVSGNSVSLAGFPGQGLGLQASGTISGSSVTGTWTSTDGSNESGTWQGTTSGCGI